MAAPASQPLPLRRRPVSASVTALDATSASDVAPIAARVVARICHRAGTDGVGTAAGATSHVLLWREVKRRNVT